LRAKAAIIIGQRTRFANYRLSCIRIIAGIVSIVGTARFIIFFLPTVSAPSTSTHPAVLPVHVAVGAIGAYDGNVAYVGYGVGTVVSPVVMDMIEAKMMADTADFMLSDNVMLLLEIVATSLINYSSPSCLSSV
jgi:hypothetical protein